MPVGYLRKSSYPNIHLNWTQAPTVPQHVHQVYVLHPVSDNPVDIEAAEDSGADRSVISHSFATELSAYVTPSRWNVIGINGLRTQTKGTAWLRVRFLGHRVYYPFEVLDTLPNRMLLGRDLIGAFELRTEPSIPRAAPRTPERPGCRKT